MPEAETFESARNQTRVPKDAPPELAPLYEWPLLTREQEQHLFRKFNYLKHRACKLRANLDPSRARTETLRQEVVFQVFSAYYALQTATRRVRTSEDLLASATQANEVALARYKAGVGSVLDLLASQSALASARAQRVEARLTWSVSLAQLAHDAGVLDPGVENPLRLTNDTTAVPQR